jgi:antirestriction protein ArdC
LPWSCAATEREIPYMKGYTVFNAEQCDGLPAHYTTKAEPPALTPMQRLEAADLLSNEPGHLIAAVQVAPTR